MINTKNITTSTKSIVSKEQLRSATAGVLELYLLATPIFVFRNLTTLQDALRPSRFKNITKEGLIWELFSRIYSISKFGDPFLEIGNPQKGRDP